MENKTWIDPKQHSIEEQVAVKSLVELKCAGVEIPTDLEYAMWWCLRKYVEKHLGIMHSGKPDEQKAGAKA
jgi:hypothetical protein